ncbi:MAG: hypothetical protein DCC58_14070 [Chloroflexi bacterium]|nr:MAG: hypothetical protein DCC58_14070 [Chloroflexota bacterium]
MHDCNYHTTSATNFCAWCVNCVTAASGHARRSWWAGDLISGPAHVGLINTLHLKSLIAVKGDISAYVRGSACRSRTADQGRIGEKAAYVRNSRRCRAWTAYGERRTLTVTSRRTAQDFAHFLHELVTVHFPAVETLRLVLDNLNAHTAAAVYEAYPAAQARAIARDVHLHFTPAHGSWLNMIEIEWSVLAQQCLKGRRLGTIDVVQHEVAAWAQARDARQATVNWRFTTDQARQTLHRLYPTPVGPDVGSNHDDVRTVAPALWSTTKDGIEDRMRRSSRTPPTPAACWRTRLQPDPYAVGSAAVSGTARPGIVRG